MYLMKSTEEKKQNAFQKYQCVFILYEYKISVTKNVKTLNQKCILFNFFVVFNQVENGMEPKQKQ